MHIDSFISSLKTERRYSPHTIKAYENDLRQFECFLKDKGMGAPGEANRRIVRDWLVNLMDSGLTPRTVRRKISALGSFYRFLLRREIIPANPAGMLTLPKTGKRLPGFVPEKNLDHLLDNIDFGSDFTGIRDRLIIEMLYFTGIRRSELASLKCSDVSVMEMIIRVKGKGGKERQIPVGHTFTAAIKGYLDTRISFAGKPDPEDPFFITARKKAVYPELIYRVVRKYLGFVTTVGNRGPHLLRHSFATHMLDHGAELNAIKDLLGHASLAATQVYTHNSPGKLKKIYKQAHPRA